ncbi:Aste57867_22079 [Aphanomyces stellatus]|uniref:Aste57867_22079 protein n=1 Tax=Aphanomyces stellatus TaxID=120398 RepID=A0A485LJG3_9STRA|nr:hypothetical protein As57867_022010 [Aphanomyces stellatus]VFT98747.1 Aste57867_22079 [Aphanomyces stellatus]
MSPTPLVLVCGWVGGSTRAVSKFTPIFHRLGLDTAVVTSSPSHLFLTPDKIHADVAASLRATAAASPTNELVVIPHVISNGGCISWQAIQHQLVAAGVRVRVPAMIFDSAPHSTTTFHSFHGDVGDYLDAVVTSWHIASPVRHALTWLALLVGGVSVSARWAAVGAADPLRRNVTDLIERAAAVPKLFLYSSADQVVPCAQVHDAIAHATALGTSVDAVNFGATPHVGHFVHAPAAYEAAIQAFMTKHTS